jgi:hypothetical protein
VNVAAEHLGEVKNAYKVLTATLRLRDHEWWADKYMDVEGCGLFQDKISGNLRRKPVWILGRGKEFVIRNQPASYLQRKPGKSFRVGKEYHSFPSGAEVKKQFSYTFTDYMPLWRNKQEQKHIFPLCYSILYCMKYPCNL